jgi:hypothetical protein
MRCFFSVIVSAILVTCMLHAQSTFRGALSGTVTDSQGATIPNAAVEVTNISTGVVYKTVASDAGTFSAPDLALGDYRVVVSYPGFAATKVDQIRISAGVTFNLPVTLSVETTTTTIEVDAAAITLDTTSQVRTFTLPKEEVSSVPINGRSFTQMNTMFPGNTTGTTRYTVDGVDNNDVYSNSVGSNQGGVGGVPGTLLPLDSIEEYSAEQQTGVESGGYSGTTVNLSIKSGTNSIHGSAYYYNRNEFFAALGPFTKANNALLQTAGKYVPKKPPIHFQEYGGSIGGPIWKDKAFYFLNYERQQYVLGQGTSSQTEPSTAWVNAALGLLAQGGVTPSTNPSITMMGNLVTTLWQPGMLTGGATTGNWTPPTSAAQSGYSNNAMMKFDQVLNQKNRLSERWYYGEGRQMAPLSTSQNPWYYQVAGERVDNVAVTLNTEFNARTANQVLMGVDFFNQPFTDAKPNPGAAGVGFIVGLGPGDTFGQPGIQISGFDGTGGTSVQSRRDLSGHLTETLSHTFGRHNLRLGAEYRRIQIYAQATGRGSSSIYTRGTFSFNGSRGYNAPYGGTGTQYPASASSQLKSLADFLQGEGSSAQLYNGSLDRSVSDNNINLYAQDSFQITQNFNVNYGLRWDYISPVGDDQRDLSVFRPGATPNSLDLTGGLAVVGQDISEPYKADVLQLAPRVGFSWQPTMFHKITNGVVIRAGAGLYFDSTGLGTWIYATSLAGNPAGTRPLYNENLSNENITPNVSIFPADAAASLLPTNGLGLCSPGVTVATCPNLGISGVDENYTMGDTTNLTASVEKSLGKAALFEVSYVGERGRHLASSYDMNQPTYGSTPITASSTIANGFLYAQRQRPFFNAYPNFAKITETSSFGSSNANAMQAYIRTRNWHGLISELSFALSTSRGTGTIEDYLHPQLDSGSNAVITNQVKGYWAYDIPGLHAGPSWLVNKWVTGGWQTAGTIYFHGAAAITASASATCNTKSGNTYALTCSGLGVGEGAGRANLTGLPRFCPNGSCAGGAASAIAATSRSKINNGVLQWFNPYAVISPPGCSAVVGSNSVGADCSHPPPYYYGTTAPGAIHGAPGFADVDLSIFKMFPITERVKVQFRGEMYNFLNHVNYAKPSLSAGNTATDLQYGGLNVASASNTGQITSTIGGTSAPGITEGEPFNVQLALRIMF